MDNSKLEEERGRERERVRGVILDQKKYQKKHNMSENIQYQ